jgi:hypothetical protein
MSIPDGRILKDASGYAMVDLLGYEIVDYSVPQTDNFGYGSGEPPPGSGDVVGASVLCCCAIPLNLYWNVSDISITHAGGRTIFPPPSELRPSGWDGIFGLAFDPAYGGSICKSSSCMLKIVADGVYNPGPSEGPDEGGEPHIPSEGVVIDWSIGPLWFIRDGFRDGQFDFTLQGNWNATTNTPTLTSTPLYTLPQGAYYVVSVAGNTDIDGNANWAVGDWIVNDNGTWVRVPYENVEDATFTTIAPSPPSPFYNNLGNGQAEGMPLKNWGLYLLMGFQWTDLGPIDSSGEYGNTWAAGGQFVFRADVDCDGPMGPFELYYYYNEVTSHFSTMGPDCYIIPQINELPPPTYITRLCYGPPACTFPQLFSLAQPINAGGSGFESTLVYDQPPVTGICQSPFFFVQQAPQGNFIAGGPVYVGQSVGSSSLEKGSAVASPTVLDEFVSCGSGATQYGPGSPNQCVSVGDILEYAGFAGNQYDVGYLLCSASEASGINDLCVKLSALSPALITCSSLTTAGSDVTLTKSGSCADGNLEWTGTNGTVNIQISWIQNPLTTESSGAYSTGVWVMIITEAATLLTIWVGVHGGYPGDGFDTPPDENTPVFGDYQEICGSNCFAANPSANIIMVALGSCSVCSECSDDWADTYTLNLAAGTATCCYNNGGTTYYYQFVYSAQSVVITNLGGCVYQSLVVGTFTLFTCTDTNCADCVAGDGTILEGPETTTNTVTVDLSTITSDGTLYLSVNVSPSGACPSDAEGGDCLNDEDKRDPSSGGCITGTSPCGGSGTPLGATFTDGSTIGP